MSALSSFWFGTLSLDDRQILSRLPQPDLITNPDVVLIGTSLWQLATACFAVEKGLKVQVLEAAPVPQFLNAASAGEVLPNLAGLKFGERFFEFAQASRDLWAKLAVRPGFEFDWKVTGSLILDPQLLQPNPRTVMNRALQLGLSLCEVDAEQLALLEPSLAAVPHGGLQGPSEGALNPARAGISFVRNFLRLGGKVCLGQEWSLHGNTIEVSGKKLTPRVILRSETSDLKLAHSVQGRTCAGTFSLSSILQRTVVLEDFVIRQLKTGELLISGETPMEHSQWVEKAHAVLRETFPHYEIPAFHKSWSETSGMAIPTGVTCDRPSEDQLVTTILLDGNCGTLLAPLLGQQLAIWLSQGTIPELLQGSK